MLFASAAHAADRLSDADVARGLVNLERMEAIAFQLQYRLAANANLSWSDAPHDIIGSEGGSPVLQFVISRLLMFATPGKLTSANDWIRPL